MGFLLLFALLLLTIKIQESTQKLSVKEESTSPLASECILYILKRFFFNCSKMSIRFEPNQTNDKASQLIKKIDLPITINADEIPKINGIEHRVPSQVNLIMDDSINITKMLNQTLWRATTQFIVIVSNQSNVDMTDIFKKFWYYNIINVIALIMDEQDVHIYSFVPFNRFDCNVDKPILLAAWSSGMLKGFTKERIINRPMENLNGCLLNITVVDLPPTVMFENRESRNGTNEIFGIEGSIIMEISRRLNFRPRFAVARDGQAWGWIQPEPHGVVGEVHQGKSQLGFGLLASTLERYEYLDTTSPTSCVLECITWAVPLGAGRASSTWVSLLVTEFPINVWCLMAVAATATIIALRILSHISGVDLNLFPDNSATAFYVFRTSLGMASKVPYDGMLRTLFLTWVWYSFIMITAYQSSMGSKLTVPLRNPDINTFRDLVQSDLHFTGFYNTFRLVQQGDQEGDVKKIADRLEATDYGIPDAVEKIIFDRNIAYMRETTTFMYNAMINPRAKGLVHLMTDCVYNYYPAMVLQKNCALTAKVNRLLRILHESGLMCKWRSKYLYNVPQPPIPVTKLSLNHMQGTFLFLTIGITIATMAFCFEQVYHRISFKRLTGENNFERKMSYHNKIP